MSNDLKLKKALDIVHLKRTTESRNKSIAEKIAELKTEQRSNFQKLSQFTKLIEDILMGVKK